MSVEEEKKGESKVMVSREGEDGSVVVEYAEDMEGIPPDMKIIFDCMVQNSVVGADFVFIRSNPPEAKLGNLISSMSTLDISDRLNLIFTALRKDLGEENWVDVVRQLAERELIGILGRKMAQRGDAN